MILHHGTAKIASTQSSLSDTPLNRVSRQITATTIVQENAKLIGTSRGALRKEFSQTALQILYLLFKFSSCLFSIYRELLCIN